jgi:YVTN family beta-propeller protein
VLPSGKAIYAIATRENIVAAINTANWQVTQRIQLAEAPEFVYIRPLAPR